MSDSSDKPTLPWYGSPRALVRTLLQLEDTPHSIALGAAIGMWIALTPTGGIQMALVMLVALATSRFFRFNRPAALVMTYVSNPLTAVPIFWGCYQLGTVFVSGDVTKERLTELITPDATRNLADMAWGLCVEVGWPMLVGSVIVATVVSVLTYPAVLWLVRTFHKPTQPAEPVAPKLTVFSPQEEDSVDLPSPWNAGQRSSAGGKPLATSATSGTAVGSAASN